jgi:murein DD-endopeptidase MepM/ murein hydrolase activator NlpD
MLLGVNVREFAYFGTDVSDAVHGTTPELRMAQLSALREMKVQVLRFYACHAALSPEQCLTHLQQALTDLQSAGMRAIVCLDDGLAVSGFFVRDTGDYRVRQGEGSGGDLGHYHKRFWSDGFRQTYLPALQIVKALADHPAVWMWELGNEYAIHPQPSSQADAAAFIAFVQEVSALIKSYSNRFVSIGLINSNQIFPNAEGNLSRESRFAFAQQLYSIPTVDYISLHYYAPDPPDAADDNLGYCEIDVEVARALNKPFYLGELGAKHTLPDRPGFYTTQIQKWRQAGADGALLWSFSTLAEHGDDTGFSPKYGDFNAICQTITQLQATGSLHIRGDLVPSAGITPLVSFDKTATSTSPTIHRFLVVDGPLNIRPEPRLNAQAIDQQLQTGEEVEVDPSSCKEADDYVWWQHALGWSAEGKSDRSEVFMTVVDPTAPKKLPSVHDGDASEVIELPDGRTIPRSALFTRLPVDLNQIQWVQYFGNTIFAYNLRHDRDPGRQTWYNYSQGLHGGFDFGNSAKDAGVPVLAGLNGTIDAVNLNSKFYPPNYVIAKSGEFIVIYGHLGRVPPLNVGGSVTPETPVGFIESTQKHLHLEIRYRNRYIVNPLLFMAATQTDPLIQRFDKFISHFYLDAQWTKWQTPYDQPALTLQGKENPLIIGPAAPRG